MINPAPSLQDRATALGMRIAKTDNGAIRRLIAADGTIRGQGTRASLDALLRAIEASPLRPIIGEGECYPRPSTLRGIFNS